MKCESEDVSLQRIEMFSEDDTYDDSTGAIYDGSSDGQSSSYIGGIHYFMNCR